MATGKTGSATEAWPLKTAETNPSVAVDVSGYGPGRVFVNIKSALGFERTLGQRQRLDAIETKQPFVEARTTIGEQIPLPAMAEELERSDGAVFCPAAALGQVVELHFDVLHDGTGEGGIKPTVRLAGTETMILWSLPIRPFCTSSQAKPKFRSERCCVPNWNTRS